MDNQKPATFIAAKCSYKGPIFVESIHALEKGADVHFSGIFANCLGCRQNFKVKKCKYQVLA